MVAAVPLATRGHFCTTANGAAVARATWGRFCLGVVITDGGDNFGGSQFLAFHPITDELASQIPVDKKVLPYLQLSDTELVVDGKKYTLVAERTPSEILKSRDDIEDILDEAVEKMGISRRKAKKELYNRIIQELNTAEEVKRSVFNDDEEIIMILVATDDI